MSLDARRCAELLAINADERFAIMTAVSWMRAEELHGDAKKVTRSRTAAALENILVRYDSAIDLLSQAKARIEDLCPCVRDEPILKKLTEAGIE